MWSYSTEQNASQLFSSLSELQQEKSRTIREPPQRQKEEDPPGKIVADLVGAMREGKLSKSEVSLCRNSN